MDWLPKSFKRSKSTTASSGGAPPPSSSSSRSSFRISRQDSSSAQTRSNGSSNSDTVLAVIPGSPRETASLSSSSNDGKSAGEHSSGPSQPSPGLPVTPEDLQFQTLHLASLAPPLGHSEGKDGQDYLMVQKTKVLPAVGSVANSSDKQSTSPPRPLADKPSTEYEKLVTSLSSRKALRTMLDE
jgi:hypothetical protein